MNRHLPSLLLLCSCLAATGRADTIFVEAESFAPSSSGWQVSRGDQSRRASRATTLWGADGPVDAVATKRMTIEESGLHRIWVRAQQVGAWRGPFRVGVSRGDKELGATVIDLVRDDKIPDWHYGWHSFDVELPLGEITLTLGKHERKNSTGYVRHVDCLLLTNDLELVPDHLIYGPQTFLRVRIGAGYERPVYLHLFADHYHDPWYAHFAIGRGGIAAALAPPPAQLFNSGEVSRWCNLTPTIYQDSGAALNFSIRHAYHDKATRFRATLEFGRTTPAGERPEEVAAGIRRRDSLGGAMQVVKAFDVTAEPNGLVVIAPPDLESPAHVALLRRDREFAEEIGKAADAFTWPTFGKKPARLPFLVTANLGGYELPVDAAVTARERQTLDYFGFNGSGERILHGLWHMKDGSYCLPDEPVMRERARHEFEVFRRSGRSLDDVAAVMLMDEPTGQPAAFAARDAGYRFRFREWLVKLGLTPEQLLVANWTDVRPVAETERDRFPALHYYTQLFRTRALGDFMATQRGILEETYGRSFPTLVNFSDGAVYHANFTSQGVDYFELLDDDRQNAIWGEDWANNSSTYQCGAYNVALMQSAAHRRGQTIGHYLIAHAGRTAWDVQTKAVGETARGVRIWKNFSYGPTWGSHEGGPAWRSHLWQRKPELWRANAETTRLIGAVEDWLLTARPPRADVAVLYSSATDIWSMQNFSYGFDRMHTWLALTHAQTPVDIVSEREIARGALESADGAAPSGGDVPLAPYRVCYLSGPNLRRDAADKLRTWVEAGGTLWLTAGAASRDEFNRPLDALDPLLPAARGELQVLDPFAASGKFLDRLPVRDTVAWNGASLEVLGVKQSLTPRKSAQTLASFQDGSPAVASGSAGKGRVIVCGFLPALSYIKPALDARRPLDERLARRLAAAAQAAAAGASEGDQPEATGAAQVAEDKEDGGAGDRSDLTATRRELVERSYNPWEFPGDVRERLLLPVRDGRVAPRVTCDQALVDVVALPCRQGTLLAVANHTLRPIASLRLSIADSRQTRRVTSVRHGELKFERRDEVIQFDLPLDAADFVTIE